MKYHNIPTLFDNQASLINGKNIGTDSVRYIQDAGQKTAGTTYIDRNTNELYVCVTTTDSVNNDGNFSKFNLKEAFNKLDSLGIKTELYSKSELYADNINSLHTCRLCVYGDIGILFMDNMYVEKGSNVKINSQGYIDLVVIPQKYSLLINSDSIFVGANGKNGRYIRAYSYEDTNKSCVGVYVGGGSFYDKQFLGSYATIVLGLKER